MHAAGHENVLSFAVEIGDSVSTLRLWVAEFLILDFTGAYKTAKLWYSAARKDATFCASDVCDSVQKASGYSILSADGGSCVLDTNVDTSPDTKPLFFAWSLKNLDNWVTNRSACPGKPGVWLDAA
jgi:hypothetical protein